MAKAKNVKHQLDTMSITVLLVMAIFGGVVGYFIGQSTAAAQTVQLREAASMMKEQGVMMGTVGKMMEQRGTRYGDRELMDQGKVLQSGGSTMMDKGSMMMTNY
jgi:hypothetical protein